MLINFYIKEEAVFACYHIKINSRWYKAIHGHTGSKNTNRMNPISDSFRQF